MNEDQDKLKADRQLAIIARYVEGECTAEELRELESGLRGNAAFRRTFLEYLNLDSALEDLASLAPPDLAGLTQAPSSTRAPLRWRAVSRMQLAGLAATVLLVASISAVLLPGRRGASPAQPVAVEVLSANGVQLADGDLIVPGDRLDVRRLRFPTGTLRAKLASGVELNLVGPADVQFENAQRLRVDLGRLTADAGDGSPGFTVVTSAGEFVDLGTRFGVDVDRGGEASLAVFSGEVRVNSPSAQAVAEVRVLGGEALRLSSKGRWSRLSSVALRREGLTWGPQSTEGLVANVTDNDDQPEFRRFYGIVAGGLSEGAPAYTDISRVAWHALPGLPFPQELLGADLVMPFHVDRTDKERTITLQLTRPASVYVLHDARKPPLPWLKAGFVETAIRLRSGPWRLTPVVRDVPPDGSGQIYLEYVVWRKDMPVAALLELGPPHVPGEGARKAMYGIAVAPLH